MTILNKQKRRVDRAWMQKVAQAAMADEGCNPEAELTVVIGDDAWIRALNSQFLNKDEPTDVLSFPQRIKGRFGVLSGKGKKEGPMLLGDIAISAEMAARQAKELGHSIKKELAILLVHGILHLMDWRDDTPVRQRRMMARTEELLTDL